MLRIVAPWLVLAGWLAVQPAHAQLSTGFIEVFMSSDNALLGYVSDTYDGQDTFTITANQANALKVEVNTTATTPFSFLELNPPDSANPYFGGVGGSGGYDFKPGQVGYSYLSGTGLTAAGSLPSFTAGNSIQALGYNGPSESTIWSGSGQDISAQWVNVDGSKDSAQTFYDPVGNYLGITGDLNAFNSAFGEGAYAVTLAFTGTLPPPPTTAVPEPSALVLLFTVVGAVGFIVRKGRSTQHRSEPEGQSRAKQRLSAGVIALAGSTSLATLR
jgi:hypothetical protein